MDEASSSKGKKLAARDDIYRARAMCEAMSSAMEGMASSGTEPSPLAFEGLMFIMESISAQLDGALAELGEK